MLTFLLALAVFCLFVKTVVDNGRIGSFERDVAAVTLSQSADVLKLLVHALQTET